MIQGLRTIVYYVTDLDKAKRWYSTVLGEGPYFDEPYYVGFEVGGFELGLVPAEPGQPTGPGGVGAYWGVPNADAAYARLLELGATAHSPVEDVGGGIRVAAVLDPVGNVFGVIENPQFSLEKVR